MDHVRKEAIWAACIVLMLALWTGVLLATETPLAINWEAVKKLPDAFSIFVILSFVFTKWLWRLRLFRGWLVRVPYLQGTWDGEFLSTWEDPITHAARPARRMILVIRQTFRSITCTAFTDESESTSRAGQIAVDEESGLISLSYNYTSRSTVALRNRSPIHDGAAHVRVVSVPNRMLEGEYWTGRCTTGQIKLMFSSHDLLERFPDPS